jgi:predicted ATP-grasp superfamily ATP-dependent carboligase
VLIAAVSARALAASARRAGFSPLVADFFGDADTVAAAHAHVRLSSGLARGIDADEIVAACATLSASRAPIGIVCGSGFEDRPDLLARLAARWPLLGNSPEVVARVKDPVAFADACRLCGVPHPEVALAQPDDPTGWLSKRIGGAGGSHIATGDEGMATGRRYFQRRVDGVPVSALLLADGSRALVLGFSIQWSLPGRGRPFRYGGAARPAPLAPQMAAAMTQGAQRLSATLGLVGLNSVDFLVTGDAFHVLEINPRPGATLDIFEPTGTSLFALHVSACRGTLPADVPPLAAAAASAIVYATADIPEMPAYDWPPWTADRQTCGTRVAADAPLCTVLASAATVDRARELVGRRAARVLADLGARAS